MNSKGDPKILEKQYARSLKTQDYKRILCIGFEYIELWLVTYGDAYKAGVYRVSEKFSENSQNKHKIIS